MTSTSDEPGVPEPTEQQPESHATAPTPRSQRMEGWVRYCEYFHMLDADMQHTVNVTNRRLGMDDGQSQSGGRVRAREHDKCFDTIVATIRENDKPLVREGGKDGKLILGEGTGAADSEMPTLGNADLAMVRARLRAAAASSNLPSELPADFAVELGDILNPKPISQTISQRKRNLLDSSDPSTCAAAIETLLWFGLALGETPRARQARDGKLGKGKRPFARGLGIQRRVHPQGSLAHDLSDAECGDVGELEFDWAQAVHAAGLSDENEAMEALEAVRALEAAQAEQNSKEHDKDAVREREEHGCAAFEVAERMKSSGKFGKSGTSGPNGGEGFDSLSEAGSDDFAKSENGSTSTMSTCDLSGDETAEPDEATPARRTRRNAKPSKWAAESFQWEESAQKHKRRKRGALQQHEGDSASRYETDSSLEGSVHGRGCGDGDRRGSTDLSIDVAMFD